MRRSSYRYRVHQAVHRDEGVHVVHRDVLVHRGRRVHHVGHHDVLVHHGLRGVHCDVHGDHPDAGLRQSLQSFCFRRLKSWKKKAVEVVEEEVFLVHLWGEEREAGKVVVDHCGVLRVGQDEDQGVRRGEVLLVHRPSSVLDVCPIPTSGRARGDRKSN